MSITNITRDQVKALMDSIADNLPQALKIRAGAWDESKHPRAPEGGKDGGQWTSTGGGHVRTREDGVVQVKHGDRGVRDVKDIGAAHRAIAQFDAENVAEKALKKAQDEGDKAAIKQALSDLDDARNEKEFGSDYDPNRPKQADIAARKAAASLARAVAKSGSVEKKFTGTSKEAETGYAKESRARGQYESAVKGIVAHYQAEGWTLAKGGTKLDKGYADAEFTKDSEKIIVRGKPWKVNVQENSWGNAGGHNTYRLYIDHYKNQNRSASEVRVELNDDDEAIMPEELRACGSDTGPFRSLRSTAGKVRRAQLFGEPHLVVPVRALVEGVVFAHGAPTPEFVPAEVYSRHAMAWNVRPVMAGHPIINGEMVSAADPAILDQRQIGWTFASNYDTAGRALDMEAWINERRSLAMGGEPADVVRRLVKGETIEVSVGAHVDVDGAAEGEHKGKKYRGAWRAVSSDHLAFLRSGERGACSIEMGCGALRAACSGDDACTCGSHNNERKDSPTMTTIDDARVQALAAHPKNAAGLALVPFLKTCTAEQATAFEATLNALPEPTKAEAKVDAPAAPRTAQEYVDAAPEGEIREMLEVGLRTAKAIKAGHVAQLRALGDKRCPYTEAQLNAMPTSQLESLVMLAGIPAAAESTVVDFSGRVPRAAADKSNAADDPYANPPDPYAAPLKALQDARAAS